MKILLTGAEGQLGRAMSACGPGWALITPMGRAQLDVGDEAAVTRAVDALRPHAIVNCAAYTAVDRAESEPQTAHRINRDGPAHLAAAASAAGARLIHISTDFVFDGTASSPYRPDAPTCPLGVYGTSKRAGEEVLGPDALIVRAAWLYGDTGANFVRTMLRLMAERDELRVVADQVGTPTYAASLAAALWGLLETGATGTLHYTDSGVASWYDFAVAIQEEALALGLLRRAVPVVPIATADYPTPARRPAYSVLDKSATLALIGTRPSHWRANLRLMLQSVARNG